MDSYYRQRDDLRAEEVVGETIILDEVKGRVNQLNPTASLIWSLCDGQHSVSDITQKLLEGFEVDPPTAERDVLASIGQLLDLELICRCEP